MPRLCKSRNLFYVCLCENCLIQMNDNYIYVIHISINLTFRHKYDEFPARNQRTGPDVRSSSEETPEFCEMTLKNQHYLSIRSKQSLDGQQGRDDTNDNEDI